VDVAVGVAESARDGVMDLLRLRSPSKVFEDIGADTIEGMIVGFASMRDLAVSGVRAVADAVKRGTNLTSRSLSSVGSDAIRGLISGISAMRNRAIAAVRSLASAVTSRLKSTLQIRSPSRVFADIGQDVVAGFADGIDAYAKKGIDAVERFANAAVHAADPAIDALGQVRPADVTVNRRSTVPTWRAADVDLPAPATSAGGVTINGPVSVGSRDDLQELRFAVRKLAIATR
jgi:hypothetical protein